MDIHDSVALVTGANRGLGRALAEHLLDRGARKVYAAARRPATVDLPGVEVLALDITDPDQARRAAERAADVTLLVNNAGTNTFQNLVRGDLDDIRSELDTHLYGTLHMVRAFAPVLGANGGGAVVNMLSAMSWFAYDGANAYHVAKAAEWALTNAIRLELAAGHTLVTGVHLGAADTDMSAGYDGDKVSPHDVARATLDGVEAGAWEVLVDDWSRHVKASVAGDPRLCYETPAGVPR
jgi:NAD(P)-dependent dehydrogenase (short-subunit alcohol dehydrogenase family)